MAARLAALLPRLVVLTLIWLLATSTITFAAAGRSSSKKQPPAAAPKQTKLLIVPDVRRQPYVFAKGILDDGGFAWRVEGPVAGHAAYTVAAQYPAPGVKVVDTGAPTIVLRLERNPKYAPQGQPENESPEQGTPLVLASEASAAAPAEQSKAKKSEAPAEEEKGAEPASESGEESGARKPDFQVPGAPPEPLDEMPLPERARLLEQRLAGKPAPTRALVRYWLYQHSWVVAGARFGWSDGAEALEILIRLDEDLAARWGVGAKSAALAKAALAEVESKAWN